MQKRLDVDFSKTYSSNSTGDFKILRELESLKYTSGPTVRIVEIQFIKTGYIREARLLSALKGDVKDPYYPTVCGVGALGLYNKTYPDRHNKRIYDVWFQMINRCYNPNNKSYHNYGGAGVKVADDWLLYENFLRDLPQIPGYFEFKVKPSKYHLDKDCRQQGIPKDQRIYSLQTCCFISRIENAMYCMQDYKQQHDCSSNMYGVYAMNNGNFQCSINYNCNKLFIGTFDDEIAAANAYNYFSQIFGYGKFNRVQYMAPFEWIPHITNSNQRNFIIQTINELVYNMGNVCIKGNIYPADHKPCLCTLIK